MKRLFLRSYTILFTSWSCKAIVGVLFLASVLFAKERVVNDQEKPLKNLPSSARTTCETVTVTQERRMGKFRST